MKKFVYSPLISGGFLFLFFLGGVFSLYGEGSRDFLNYPGHRLFYNVEQSQQLKVYANEGEFINVGSSHVAINGGTIEVYDPSGNLIAVFDGTNDEAIIFNNIQELAGPTGGGVDNGQGYIPGVVPVMAGQEGIWSVRLRYPEPFRHIFTSNLLNSDPWTRANDQPNDSPFAQRVALAWDVTVTTGGAGNDGGTQLTGRLYSNEYISILDGQSTETDPRSTSPTLYILTPSGYLYQLDFDRMDPWGFPVHSNSVGIVDGNLTPTYSSRLDDGMDYVRSSTPSRWDADGIYLYEPQAEDFDVVINNKIFFNLPDTTMPSEALVTDIAPDRQNTHLTWLYRTPIHNPNNNQFFSFRGALPTNASCSSGLLAEAGSGGYFVFDTDLEGTAILEIDWNNDGDYQDSVDMTLRKSVILGRDSIYWNGRNAAGEVIGENAQLEFNYRLTIRGGEIHLLMLDVENTFGGATMTRLNGPDSPDSLMYYDHSVVGGAVSGGGTPGNPLPTTESYIYDQDFGDNKLLDQWAYIESSNFGAGLLTLTVENYCQPTDHDNDGIDNIVDLDDDNDGILDSLEYCYPGGGWACLPAGADPGGDNDADGIPNFDDSDDPAINNNCVDADSNGVCDIILAIYDQDGDNVPNHLDLDSDNDGISDLVEAGHEQPDSNQNGVIDGPATLFGNNGFYNPLESDDSQNAESNFIVWDTDTDSIPDFLDLDSDNDGITDVIEAGYLTADADRDGRIDIHIYGVDENGLTTIIAPNITGTGIPLPVDWDNDGVADWHDLDSDNDGILDVIEGGYPASDSDGDGRIDDGLGNVPAVNGDGLAPMLDPAQTGVGINPPPDSDNDTVRDWHDLDSDNDGINGTVENNNPDGDNDGFIGTGPLVVDGNGIVIADSNGVLIPTAGTVNTDGDALPDYLDLDSDDDSFLDVIEGGNEDPDNDGIAGTGTPVVNQYGQVPGATSNPPDSNNSGTPDFQERFICSALSTPGILVENANVCAGDTLNFAATLADTNNIVLYEWTFTGANGVTDTLKISPDSLLVIPNVSAANSGTYSLMLRQDTCVSAVVDVAIIVSEVPPAPVLTTTATEVCEDTPFTLTLNNPESDVSYAWTFIDSSGTPAVLPTPVDTFFVVDSADLNQIGTYRIIATRGACASVPSNDIAITILPKFETPVFSVSNDSLCQGEPVTLSAQVTDTTHLSFQWILVEPGQTARVVGSSFSPTITLDTSVSGNYYVEVRDTSYPAGICPAAVSNIIPVTVGNIFAAPDIQSNAAGVICPGDSVALWTTTPFNEANPVYEWYLNGVLAASTTDSFLVLNNVQVTDAGSYSLIMRSGGCFSNTSAGLNLDVRSPLLGSIGRLPTGSICAGAPLVLTAPNFVGATFLWTGPNGFTSTADTVNFAATSVADNGAYNVTVTLDGCSTTIGPLNLNVQPQPVTPTISANTTVVCTGDNFTLAASGNPGGGFIHNWLLGDSLIASTVDSTVTISAAEAANTGDYRVVVIAGDCVSDTSAAVSIAVQPPLTGAIEQLPAGGVCEGESLTLIAPNFAGATYSWTGPNGFTSTTDTITFATATTADNGTYNVIVTQNGCSTTLGPLNLNIQPKPATPAIAVNTTTVCTGDSFTLTATGSLDTGLTYDWLLGDSLIASTADSSLTIGLADAAYNGAYRLVVSAGGCSSDTSAATTMTIQPPLQGIIEQQPVGGVCPGESLTLIAPIFAGATYSWTGPNGFTAITDSVVLNNISAADNGTYNVSVTLNGCSTVFQLASLNIQPAPATPSIIADATTVCTGDSFTLSATGDLADGVIYNWLLGDSLIASTVDSTLTVNLAEATDAGDYRLVINDNGCISDTSAAVSIAVQLPLTGTIEQQPTGGVCEGESLTLIAPTFAGATYAWTGPNGFTSTADTITFVTATTTDNGTYTVIVTQNGCSTTLDSLDLNIQPKPATPAIAANTPTVCTGDSFTLTATGSLEAGLTYDWLLGDSLIASTADSSLTIDMADAANNGAYRLVVRAGGCTSDTSAAITMTVQPPLEGTIEQQPAGSVCAGESLTLIAPNFAGATYLWTGPNGFTATTDTVIINNVATADNGNYSVTVMLDGCSTTFSPVNLDIQPKPSVPVIQTSRDSVCRGEEIVLSATGNNDTTLQYEWIVKGNSLGISDNNELILDGEPGLSGEYQVIAIAGSCFSDTSETLDIVITAFPDSIIIAPTSPICIGEMVQLATTQVEGATYEWTGPAGFTSDEISPTVTIDAADNLGTYTVQITKDACSFAYTTTLVQDNATATPVVAWVANPVCQGNAATLNITNSGDYPATTQFTVLDENGNIIAQDTTFALSFATDTLEGNYFYTVTAQSLQGGGCDSNPSEMFELTVAPQPQEMAMIIGVESNGNCGETAAGVEAVAPAEGIGNWSSTNPSVDFEFNNLPNTIVGGLTEGDNLIIWTLSDEVCGVYSADSVIITVTTPLLIANDDAFTLLNTETITDGNIIGNDQVDAGQITITSSPSNGTVTLNGNAINYVPDAGFTGTDQITYELCSVVCPTLPCQTATVTFTVEPDPATLICTVPDVITPNNDGLNDVLVIPCSEFKSVSIQIFNRWGDQVFASDNYQNDWRGTHDGNPLPPGPYYFVFEENGAEPVTGCVSIAR